ncbi:hypothetical protein BSZ35_15610 [Salinibacter sp. 10B]|uniref:hypothetical protein n=1 Tax=Salinibacter sp. 10B TaxID=1923971 RepID=UPI000CF4881C|nr:hypothetical protein [Salinibacter sp. 10B]PQJ35832.1 hypothetical protein BSZ35_15610 [Salinibacter sp. 10B]
MNVALLNAARQSIATVPHRFCAAQWAFARNAEAVLRREASPEGFRCCIAGHVLLETGQFGERELLKTGGFHTGGGLWMHAAERLLLTEAQGRELFFPSQWDRPHKQDYYLCSREEEADVATTYIDYFLQKHEERSSTPFGVEHDPKRVEREAHSISRSSIEPVLAAREE